jgi:hypothetical protein
MMRLKRRQRSALPFKVVSSEQAEHADSVLCMPDGQGEFFSDDVRTTCAECGRRIHHRPHVPKKPRKLCPDCVLRYEVAAKN